jgi:hypothetical protein
MKGHEIRLAARPDRLPDAGNFSLVEVDVRDPATAPAMPSLAASLNNAIARTALV